MTEQEWLSSTSPQRMLTWLTATYGPSGYYVRHNNGRPISERKLRLFAVACCRQVWDQLTDPRSRRAVEVAERYADGEATAKELADAHMSIRDVGNRDWAAYPAVTVGKSREGIVLALEGCWSVRERANQLPSPAVQAALLRDICGNPFRPIAINQDWLRWNCSTIPALAERIYEHRDWGLMGMLHDALIDAGCTDEAILNHCRGLERCSRCLGAGTVRTSYHDWAGPIRQCDEMWGAIPGPRCANTGWVRTDAPHVRGCWVVDLILGKD